MAAEEAGGDDAIRKVIGSHRSKTTCVQFPDPIYIVKDGPWETAHQVRSLDVKSGGAEFKSPALM